jgi:hypothetical protein
MVDPLDFLAEVSTHIPDGHEKTTLFYGWYSSRTRGHRERHGLLGEASPVEPVSEEVCRVALEARRSWARLIRRVSGVAPLLCARCGGTMKIIAVIERPAAIRQILDHLGLPTIAAKLRAPPEPPGGQGADQARKWSYEPCFDLPVRSARRQATSLSAIRARDRKLLAVVCPSAAPRWLSAPDVSLDTPSPLMVASLPSPIARGFSPRFGRPRAGPSPSAWASRRGRFPSSYPVLS